MTEDIASYRPDNFDLRKPNNGELEIYRAPTWSWASFHGGRVWMEVNTINGSVPMQNIASIVKVHINPADVGPFGKIESAYLDIKGSLFPLGDLQQRYWKYTTKVWNPCLRMDN
jgi:hypothetical protein